MIKTRVAHGYCSRHLTAGACSYANICEQCDNYIPDPGQQPVLESQLADVIELRDDAERRGWTDERIRHQHVTDALTRHLNTIDHPSQPLDTNPEGRLIAFGIVNHRNYRIRALLYAGKPNWDLLPTLEPR